MKNTLNSKPLTRTTKHVQVENQKCYFCNKQLKTLHTYKKHLATYHLKEFPFKCKHCKSKFTSSLKLHLHEGTHHLKELKDLKCPACDKIFRQPKSLNNHLENVHKFVRTVHRKEEPFFCHDCRKGFSNATHLKQHMQTHLKRSERELYKCDMCSEEYLRKYGLARHKKFKHLHHPQKTFNCALCPAIMGSKYSMLRHVKYKHDSEYPFPCPLCASQFKFKVGLHSHISAIHTKERPYKCGIEGCTQGFIFKGRLKSHQRRQHFTRLNPQPALRYPCTDCGATFKYKKSLQRHVDRGHEVTTECTVCGKRLRKVSLRAHTRVVHNQDIWHRFACYFCSYKSTYQYALYHHLLRMHVKERSFKCYFCGKLYASQRPLTRHMFKHFNLKPYNCSKCTRAYVSYTGLWAHTKAKH